MDFSPPRMPRNSPSYLIWSIFTKEREERAKRKAGNVGKAGNGRASSPLCQAPLRAASAGDEDFAQTLLNAKLAELEREAEKVRGEAAAVQRGRRRLQEARRKLSADVEAFEKAKEADMKKLEEERRRAKRDRTMLERAQKEKVKGHQNTDRAASEIADLQAKVRWRLQSSLSLIKFCHCALLTLQGREESL